MNKLPLLITLILTGCMKSFVPLKQVKNETLNITIQNGSRDIYWSIFNKNPISSLLNISTSYNEKIAANITYFEDTLNQKSYNYTFVGDDIVYPPHSSANAARFNNQLAIQETYAFSNGFVNGGPSGMFYWNNRLFCFGTNTLSSTSHAIQYLDLTTGVYSSLLEYDPAIPYLEFVTGTNYAFFIDSSGDLNYLNCSSFSITNTGNAVTYSDIWWFEYDTANSVYVIIVGNGGSNTEVYKYAMASNTLTSMGSAATINGRPLAALYHGNLWYINGTSTVKLNISSSSSQSYQLFVSINNPGAVPYMKINRLCIDTNRNVIICGSNGTGVPIVFFGISEEVIIQEYSDSDWASVGVFLYDSYSNSIAFVEQSAGDVSVIYWDESEGKYVNTDQIYQGDVPMVDVRNNSNGEIVLSGTSIPPSYTSLLNLSEFNQAYPIITVNGSNTSLAELNNMAASDPIVWKKIDFYSTNRNSYLDPLFFNKDNNKTSFRTSGVSLYQGATAYDRQNVVTIKPKDIDIKNVLGDVYHLLKKIPAGNTENLTIRYDQIVRSESLIDTIEVSEPKKGKSGKKRYIKAHFNYILK